MWMSVLDNEKCDESNRGGKEAIQGRCETTYVCQETELAAIPPVRLNRSNSQQNGAVRAKRRHRTSELQAQRQSGDSTQQ